MGNFVEINPWTMKQSNGTSRPSLDEQKIIILPLHFLHTLPFIPENIVQANLKKLDPISILNELTL